MTNLGVGIRVTLGWQGFVISPNLLAADQEQQCNEYVDERYENPQDRAVDGGSNPREAKSDHHEEDDGCDAPTIQAFAQPPQFDVRDLACHLIGCLLKSCSTWALVHLLED